MTKSVFVIYIVALGLYNLVAFGLYTTGHITYAVALAGAAALVLLLEGIATWASRRKR